VADIGGQVAQNGFKWIFVLTGHASPTHGVAVNGACDFVSETFGVEMLHISGLFRADPKIQARAKTIAEKHYSASDIASFGLDVHAGVAETSVNLARRRDLVDPGYGRLRANSGQTFDDLQALATRPGWQGYLSAPAKATAAYGRDIEAWWVDGLSELILRATGGREPLEGPTDAGRARSRAGGRIRQGSGDRACVRSEARCMARGAALKGWPASPHAPPNLHEHHWPGTGDRCAGRMASRASLERTAPRGRSPRTRSG
jgi:hypothetical protein